MIFKKPVQCGNFGEIPFVKKSKPLNEKLKKKRKSNPIPRAVTGNKVGFEPSAGTIL